METKLVKGIKLSLPEIAARRTATITVLAIIVVPVSRRTTITWRTLRWLPLWVVVAGRRWRTSAVRRIARPRWVQVTRRTGWRARACRLLRLVMIVRLWSWVDSRRVIVWWAWRSWVGSWTWRVVIAITTGRTTWFRILKTKFTIWLQGKRIQCLHPYLRKNVADQRDMKSTYPCWVPVVHLAMNSWSRTVEHWKNCRGEWAVAEDHCCFHWRAEGSSSRRMPGRIRNCKGTKPSVH